MLVSVAAWLQSLSPELGFLRVFPVPYVPRRDGGDDDN